MKLLSNVGYGEEHSVQYDASIHSLVNGLNGGMSSLQASLTTGSTRDQADPQNTRIHQKLLKESEEVSCELKRSISVLSRENAELKSEMSLLRDELSTVHGIMKEVVKAAKEATTARRRGGRWSN